MVAQYIMAGTHGKDLLAHGNQETKDRRGTGVPTSPSRAHPH
jgi:hypothetical protein